MTKEDLRGIQRTLSKNRCWKGYAPVRGKKAYSKGSCRKVRGNPVKTRGVDVFVFMKDKFAYSEAENDIDKISRKNKGRDIGGGTDMRTGLREQQYYFRSQGDAVRFMRMVRKLGVTKGYRASYASGDNRKSLRLNPAKCDAVTSMDWEEKENTLVYEKSLKPVCVGQKARSFRGDIWTVRGGDAPHKPSSTGRVYVTAVKNGFNRQFFPTVFKMKWVPSYNLFPVDRVSGQSRLRMNSASFSDEQIERSYKILTRYGRLRRLLKKHDVLELFPAGVRIQLIRKDPETMKLLPQLDEFMLAGNVNRRLIVDRVQGALDAYVDELEQELERDARNDARAYREVERRG